VARRDFREARSVRSRVCLTDHRRPAKNQLLKLDKRTADQPRLRAILVPLLRSEGQSGGIPNFYLRAWGELYGLVG
jgi:hypothetical protein